MFLDFCCHIAKNIATVRGMQVDESPYSIKPFTYDNGTTVFRLSGMKTTVVDGAEKRQQIRKNFKTMAEAVSEKQKLDAEFHNLPEDVPMVRTRLTPEQAAEAERAFIELNGQSLLKAVRFYLENYREAVRQIKFSEAFEQFLKDKEAANARPLTIRNLRTRVGFVNAVHGERHVSEILPDHLKEIVFRPGRGPVTADNDRRAVGSFFAWATRQGFCASNPVDKLEAVTVERDEPEIFALDCARTLLRAALGYKEGLLVPYVALGLFCAIRPKELERLTWDDIDIEAQTVTLGAKIAKMRERRIVEISDNCMKWLLPHAAKRTPLVGPNWRRDFDAVKRAAGYGGRDGEQDGLKPWPVDVMRHTGISAHLVEHEHEGKTAAWAGNSPDIIQRHYKGLMKKADSKEFWSLTPKNVKGKILKLKAA